RPYGRAPRRDCREWRLFAAEKIAEKISSDDSGCAAAAIVGTEKGGAAMEEVQSGDGGGRRENCQGRKVAGARRIRRKERTEHFEGGGSFQKVERKIPPR